MLFLGIGPDTAKGHARPWKEHGHGPEYQHGEYANEKSALRAEKISGQGIVFQAVLMYITRGESVCTQNPHIHKFLAVFLYGFSRAGSAAASVIGLRRPLSAVCAEGCVSGRYPYCFIVTLLHFAGTKISMYRIPSKDFGILVVPFFHVVVPFIHAIPSICLYFSCLRMSFITGSCTALPSPSGTGSPVAAGCFGSGRPRTPLRSTQSY